MKQITIKSSFALLSTIATLALASFLFSSCKNREDGLFDQSAGERLSHQMQEVKTKLVGSEQGWIMDYYPHEQKKYGGYVIALKFTDKGELLATSEALLKDKDGNNKPLEWLKSNYTIGKDRGVTLNFTTYNQAIHHYSTPDVPYGEGPGIGFAGDHEFLVMTSDSPDLIILEGKKTHNVIKLHRSKKDLSSYMEEVRACKGQVYTNAYFTEHHKDSFRGKVEGKEAIFTLNDEGYNVYNVQIKGRVKVDANGNKVEEEEAVNQNLPFHYTPTGIIFDEPFKGIKGFTWSEAEKCFIANGEKFIAHDDPDYPAFSKFLGEWELRLSTLDNKPYDSYDITFETYKRNVYLIKGLPFKMYAGFDPEHNRFFINAQIIENKTFLQAVALQEGGFLSQDESVGMYAKLLKGSSNIYEFHDNGAWGSYKVDGFILWGGAVEGEYTKFGLSRLFYPQIVKK